jgi:hypothetical protein
MKFGVFDKYKITEKYLSFLLKKNFLIFSKLKIQSSKKSFHIMKTLKISLVALLVLLMGSGWAQTKKLSDEKIEALKQEVREKIEGQQKMAQVMVDKVFSFAELGFQEFETSKYLTDILKENGFEIEYGISGVPTAWWGQVGLR